MANPCTPQPCPANQKWNSRRCKCDVDLEQVYREATTNRRNTEAFNEMYNDYTIPADYNRGILNNGSGLKPPTPTDPTLGGAKKGGSIIKGSSLRRQASTKGLRTSKKH